MYTKEKKLVSETETNSVKYYSQIGQDKIVLDLLNQKRNGTFLDIGCYLPTEISNTMTMETHFGWSGLALDIDCSFGDKWASRTKSKFICADATSVDWVTLLRENQMPTTIDFLSLDLEPPVLAFSVLKKLPFDQYRFNTIAFEHDDYRGTGTKISSRKYLEGLGYVLVRELNGLGVGGQDDIWIHSSLVGGSN
jgi:hypothetical protein